MEIEEEKRKYRTKTRASDVDEIPEILPVITNGKYFQAMYMVENKSAYIYPLKEEKTPPVTTSESSDEKNDIIISGGKILIRGRPASVATIKNYLSSERVLDIDVVTLKLCYGIILAQYEEAITKGIEPKEIVTVYYPDLARKMGKAANLGSKDVYGVINDLMAFQTMVGITKSNDVLPLLVFMGYDDCMNVIKFASPYISKIVREIYKDSIKTDKTGRELLKGNGLPDTKPCYSYLIDSRIASQRNKRAVELVCIIVQLIERVGRRTPHIAVKTILDRHPILMQSLQHCKRNSERNIILKRVFQKAFELLRTHTRLAEKYKNIQLPDPADKETLPTMDTLDLVLEFPHDGIIKGKIKEDDT